MFYIGSVSNGAVNEKEIIVPEGDWFPLKNHAFGLFWM